MLAKTVAWLRRSPARPSLAKHYSILRRFRTGYHLAVPEAADAAMKKQRLVKPNGKLTILGQLFLELNKLA